MKVVRIHRYGGPEVMQIDDVPQPPLAAGQVLVRVVAAGVNFFDAYIRRAPLGNSFYPAGLPMPLGGEGAGTVEAVGPEVTSVNVGDRVAWGGAMGSYADLAIVPARVMVPLPPTVSFEQGAAVLTQGIMAHILCRSTYPLKAGDTCLIHTIAGGVGLLLCQMAKICGAKVIGTTSTREKAQAAYQAGADNVLLYSEGDLSVKVRELTEGKGVDVIYDAVGKDTFEQDLDSLAPRGMLALYGQASGPVPPIDVMTLAQKGSLMLTRVVTAHYVGPEEMPWRVRELFTWLSEGRLHMQITKYPLAEVARAHEELEQRRNIGKLLLIP